MTLAEFLRARIADDEAVAWRADLYLRSLHAHDEPPGISLQGERVWSLSRAMDECDAKRTIVESAEGLAFIAANGETILCALAAVYADHPDYRDEWKPKRAPSNW